MFFKQLPPNLHCTLLLGSHSIHSGSILVVVVGIGVVNSIVALLPSEALTTLEFRKKKYVFLKYSFWYLSVFFPFNYLTSITRKCKL